MGIDLTILIVHKYDDQQGHAHSMLEWGRANGIPYFNSIFTMPLFELNSYLAEDPNEYKEGSHYGKMGTNPYGDSMSYIKVKDFINQAKTIDKWQQGIIAFLCHLNSDTILGLYYH
jgi:hypothetical protein